MTNCFRHWIGQIRYDFSFMTNLWRKMGRHRSRVTLAYLWWIQKIIIELNLSMMRTDRLRISFGMRGRGLPRWWFLQLEMLSTCTCYSRFHWRWFGYMSPCYWTTWPSLVLACLSFLMDHASGPCCSTCQFSTSVHVVLRLGHVWLLQWALCHIFNGPCGCFLFDHVSRCCPSGIDEVLMSGITG
jgi:hypothetical protein